MAACVAYGAVPAGVDAVHACHAARVVYFVLFAVDAGGFAVALAQAAGIAFGCVYDRAQQRKSGEVAQYRAYGAYGVAICAAVFPR